MQETREKLALTAVLLALLIVLVWIGMVVTERRQSRHPVRFADAQWTMKHVAREDGQ
ncbi:MAG: hypothetical protein FWD25_10145 [Clostridia bacterium]|nr:hypothetical protein [Clostridia bacterium]